MLSTKRNQQKSDNSAQANSLPITVITGGSDGIGRALASEFARFNHRLLLVARREDKLKTAADELKDEFNAEVYIFSIDLTEPDGCHKLKNFIERQNFYVENLVNNAGMGVSGNFVDQDPASVLKMIDLNLRSCTELMTLFLPYMMARKSGGVLNVASLAGMGPVPFLSVYAATKAYMVSLTKTVGEELRGTGVKMCMLAPGPVDTAFFEVMGNDPQNWIRKIFFLPPDVVARVGYNGFLLNQRLIVPGLLSSAGQVGLKLLPHNLTGFLYKRIAIRVNQFFPW